LTEFTLTLPFNIFSMIFYNLVIICKAHCIIKHFLF